MKIAASILALFLVVLLISCDSETASDERATIRSLFPLTVGNNWRYLFTEFDTNGALEAQDTLELTINSAGTLNGHTGVYASVAMNPVFLYFSSNDLWNIDVSQPDDSALSLRYPLSGVLVLRDTTSSGLYRSRRTMRIVSEKEKITVPAGSFDCIKYETLDENGAPGEYDTASIDFMYFAPNIGLIAQQGYIHRQNRSRLKFKNELISYTLK